MASSISFRDTISSPKVSGLLLTAAIARRVIRLFMSKRILQSSSLSSIFCPANCPAPCQLSMTCTLPTYCGPSSARLSSEYRLRIGRGLSVVPFSQCRKRSTDLNTTPSNQIQEPMKTRGPLLFIDELGRVRRLEAAYSCERKNTVLER